MSNSGILSKLKGFGGALWSETRRAGKLTALKGKLVRLRRVSLKAAHYAFGKKCYELGLHKEKFATEFAGIAELEKQIAEKKTAKPAQAKETKSQKGKRIFGNVWARVEVRSLSRRMKKKITALGQLAAVEESSDVGSVELERVKLVQRQITKSDDEHSALCKDNTGTGIHPVRYWAIMGSFILLGASASVALIIKGSSKYPISTKAPEKKPRGLHLSIDDLELMTRCKFLPAIATQGVGAKIGIHSTNRLIMVTTGSADNITSLKMCLILGDDKAEMADSRLALMLFDLVLGSACNPEAKQCVNGKLKAVTAKARDFEPPSRMFGEIAIDIHSKIGIGVGYNASDGRISEKTSELAFEVTITTSELF